jgi:hypothetical protein
MFRLGLTTARPAELAELMAPLHEAAELSPGLIKRLRAVEQKHRKADRRSELEFLENGPHYVGFDKDAAIEEFKRNACGRELIWGRRNRSALCPIAGVSGRTPQCCVSLLRLAYAVWR